MTEPSVVKLDPSGPEQRGLTRRPPYPEEGLETEPPVHSSHLYVNDEERGIKIGVWECTPHTSKMNPFPVNEFMILLEGSVTMLEEDGKATTVRAGEAFVVPKGAVCQWRQSENVRKYFAIYGGMAEAGPRAPEAPSVVRVPLRSDVDGQGNGPPPEARPIYSDSTGNYALSTWDGTSEGDNLSLPGAYQLIHIGAGSLTLSGGDETATTYRQGDTILVAPGKAVAWTGTDDLQVLSCRINVSGAAA